MEENKLNVNKLGEAFARALTVHFEKEYPGVKFTLKFITEKENTQKRKV